MNRSACKKHEFYGTATLGTKGQVVIPSEARTAMNIEPGDKLLVFSMGHDMLVMTSLSQVETIAKHMSDKLDMIRGVLKAASK